MTQHPVERIVHVTECLAAGTLGFLEQATRELAAAGLEQVLVYSRRPDTPEDVRRRFHSSVRLVEVEGPGKGLRAYHRALRAALGSVLRKDTHRTAVHLHSSKAGFIGRLALRGLPQPQRVLYSPHGLSFLNRRFWLPGQVFHLLEWVAARVQTSTLVGCSRSEAQLLSSLSGQRAQVLENAVDDSFLAVQRRMSADAPPLVLAMGRVCYQKAPEVFAALAAQFRIAEINARFVWIGNGDPSGEEHLRAAGVEVTGWVDRTVVQGLLAQASVLVQTSRWEGMPLSVLQAMAAGVPCVVTDAVGNRDAVRHGVNGFVTERLDSMLVCVRRLVEDTVLQTRFSHAARQDAQRRFSSASFRARLLALYGHAVLHDPLVEPLVEQSCRPWAQMVKAPPGVGRPTAAAGASRRPVAALQDAA